MNLSRAITEALSSQLKTRRFVRPFVILKCSPFTTATQSATTTDLGFVESLVKDLVESPTLWVDHRKNKLNGMLNPMYPDFEHTDSGSPLWIDEVPNSVLLKLDELQFHPPKDSRVKAAEFVESLWKELLEKPNEWLDNRKIKVNPKYPDFKHKEDKDKALWLNVAPSWALLKLDELEFHPPKDSSVKAAEFVESLWKELLEKPNEWLDNRKIKVNPKYPDFKHKEDKDKALWLNVAPSWALLKLDELEFHPPKDSSRVKAAEFVESLWKELLEKPNEWLDNRKIKANPKYPDFKHKEDKDKALWLNVAPSWALLKLDELEFHPPKGPTSAEESWKNLVENLNKWWDNRFNKRNPKSPDFKHKDTGDALWLNSAPAWVLPKLPPGKSEDEDAVKDREFIENLWKDLFEKPNEWLDNRKTKVSPRHPDFKHKGQSKISRLHRDSVKALWLNEAQKWVLLKVDVLEVHPPEEVESVNSLVKDLVERPSQWVDHRKDKLDGLVKPTYPDFKHKDSGQPLWINKLPNWVLLKLDELQFPPPKDCKVKSGGLTESLWKELLEKPKDWLDYRKIKVNPKYPDFKHKEDKSKALWLNVAPRWALLKLDELEFHPPRGPASAEESWKNLVENLNKWWDNRFNKRNPKAPDFKHKDTGDALWLNSAPAWVLPKLPPGKSEDAEDEWVLVVELAVLKFFVSVLDVVNPKCPDFTHKDSGAALWLDGAPRWALLKLEELEFHPPKDRMVKSMDITESPWKELLEKPNDWLDNRKIKVNPKYPDFEHRDSGKTLWLNEAPKWVLSKVDVLEFHQSEDSMVQKREIVETMWKDLVEKPKEWPDYRKRKIEGSASPKYPDFVQKGSSQPLWLNAAPEFVPVKLEELEFHQPNVSQKTTQREKESIAKWANLGLPPSAKAKLVFKNGTKLPQIETTWPKPTEIPWQAKIANSVNLIGSITEPVQVELTDGKYIAGTVLTQEDSMGSDPLWIPIVFEGDLALVAACHLKKNDLVYIAGRVSGDPPKFTMEQGQSSLRVMVHSLNYVKESDTEKQSGASSRDNLDSSISGFCSITRVCTSVLASSDAKTQSRAPFQDVLDSSSSDEDRDFLERSWSDFFEKRLEWQDRRNDKVSSKLPDFTHKISIQGLWISSAPKWAVNKLKFLEKSEHEWRKGEHY
ncbi:hypothetical protein GIB67_023385 [Kingdonia uniflora]|uniref:Uncharacterized protein n=1 Tax=Kingdonia uniflora TaxID=39325 RepID=A0A7J7LIL8_9MAGN|nr:hypothetical protein GIB67_023385 [Kingdonia uniflora]